MNSYEEGIDENGNPVHFVPVKTKGVNGYRVVKGPSPKDHSNNEKRKKARSERNRKNKHKKRNNK